jgi:von Willebrand factor type A domain
VKAVLTLALLLAASKAWAEAGLDLVVLVDRSTSMAGDAQTSTLLLRMTLDLVARNAAIQHVEHRLAVIGFGSSAAVEVPFTPVRPGNVGALRRRIESLPGRDRGDTDVLAAFVAAERLFRALPSDPARRRAIVLLTDGVPYVRGADMTAYRARLQQFVSAHFPRSRVSIDVLLAGRTHDRALWQGIARNVYTAPRSADAVLAEAHGVIAQLIGTRTSESAPSKRQQAIDTLAVPPYLDVIVFDVFRASPGAAVEIYPPGQATPIRGGAKGVESVILGDVLATLIVPRPPPGEWTIRKSRADARVRILSQQFFPRGVLVSPAPADALRQHDRIPLAYRVIDSSNRPLAELRDYALSVEIALTDPGGATSLVRMERDPMLGPAVFRGTGEADCTLPGRYWTDVRITTTDVHRHRLEVFRDRWSGFSVTPAERVDCRVTAAQSATWLPLTARVDCALGNRPAEMSAIASGAPATLFRALISRDGQPADATLDLHYLGRGAFRGSLRGAWEGGAYQLQLAADRSRLRPSYNIRFIPPRLAFAHRSPVAWIVIAGVSAAAIVAMLLRRRKTRSK